MTDRGPLVVVNAPWQVLGIGLAAAAVALGCFVTLNSSGPAAAARTVPFTISNAPDHPGALFVGDSYAVGVGQSAGTGGGFACQTAVLLHWNCLLDAVVGTGYVNTGHVDAATFGPYASRLKVDASAYLADFVVVTGGRNDPAGVATDTAAAAYVAKVSATFPHATLIVVAPFWNNASPPAGLLSLRTALRTAATAVGATFIDPLAAGWGLPVGDVSDDGVHPNTAGHTYLAHRLAAAIKAALPTVTTASASASRVG